MQKYNVAILGCGAIFGRHLAAIDVNSEHYKLVGIFDPITQLRQKYAQELHVKEYASEEQVYLDHNINCIVILSPSSLHYKQALRAIQQKKHVILEKPATFLAAELVSLESAAKEYGVNIFGVLQVRLNPAVIVAKMAYEQGLLGHIRSVSLVQRWQRPQDYFTGWRGSMDSGGGILREFAIHYLDALQFIVGAVPKVTASNAFSAKFKDTDVADTLHAMFNFGDFGGMMEISIAAEPKNLECSLSIMAENGFIKLGGKSLDEIIACDFLQEESCQKFAIIQDTVNSRHVATLVSLGASPYHPELYRQIILNPASFTLHETYNVIKLIEQIYACVKTKQC